MTIPADLLYNLHNAPSYFIGGFIAASGVVKDVGFLLVQFWTFALPSLSLYRLSYPERKASFMPRLDSFDPKEFGDNLQNHRASPNVSATEHKLRKERDLAKWVLERKRMYLDTSWWIDLLNVRLGRSKNAKHEDLLLRLHSLVQSGVLICPIGEGIFMELLKQDDVATRTPATVLMDDLSAGVTIIDSRRRARVEALYFLTEVITKQAVAGPPLDRVWTKVGMVLGVPRPVWPKISEEEQLAIDKAFFDLLWSRSLAELLDDSDPAFDREDLTLLHGARRITATSAALAHEMTSFKEVFLAEVGGFIDLNRGVLGAAFEEVLMLGRPGDIPITAAERQEAQELARRWFYNLFRYRKIGNSLPIIRIYAGLYAMNRWLRNRRFRLQDYYDFAHASAAIPYCDYFLTEKHLATVVTGSWLRFDKRYGVSVMHTVEEALDALNRLAA